VQNVSNKSIDYHRADNDKTQHKYNQKVQKNLNKQTRKPLTYAQTKPNEAEAWFRGLFSHWARERSGQFYSSGGPHEAKM